MSNFGILLLRILLCALIQLTTTNADGLTDAELAQFTVSGKFEASVRIDTTQTDRFSFYFSGMPDHSWEMIDSNRPLIQNFVIEIPKTPISSPIPGCIPIGIIGLTRTGVALYNPLTIQGQNAVEGDAAEVFDSCDGHADAVGVYHYHKLPKNCLYRHEVDEFIGVALDGYPIYGPIVSAGLINHGGLEKGGNVTSAHLDKCHGTTVNGKYRYYMTEDFPYILGCFKGFVIFGAEIVSYNTCVNNTSSWNADWGHYYCHCTAFDVPAPGGVVGPNEVGMLPPECAPDYPNRPDTCPPIVFLDCSPYDVNRPDICDIICSENNVGPRLPSCDATTTSAAATATTTRTTTSAATTSTSTTTATTTTSAVTATTTTATTATTKTEAKTTSARATTTTTAAARTTKTNAETTTTPTPSQVNLLSDAIIYKPYCLLVLFVMILHRCSTLFCLHNL